MIPKRLGAMQPAVKTRIAATGDNPSVLADIYRDDVNIAIWQRKLSGVLREAVGDFVSSNTSFKSSMSVSPDNALDSVAEVLRQRPSSTLCRSIAELVEMFCCLLGLQRAGLRMSVLGGAMCPRFHVDKVPCRLVTTYRGSGTEWLRHDSIDRSKLGTGSRGLPDHESGLYGWPDQIQQLVDGDVALLKGELWKGNENAGLVHRSPSVKAGDTRLLVTVDVSR